MICVDLTKNNGITSEVSIQRVFTSWTQLNSWILRLNIHALLLVLALYNLYFLLRFILFPHRKSKWSSASSPCKITTITSEGCLSVGDALREIDGQSLIKSDFILVNGDLVSNMNLKALIQEHKWVKTFRDFMEDNFREFIGCVAIQDLAWVKACTINFLSAQGNRWTIAH